MYLSLVGSMTSRHPAAGPADGEDPGAALRGVAWGILLSLPVWIALATCCALL